MIDPQERIRALEEQIAELKANWPAHSVQPWMLEQLEDLEAELEKLKEEAQDETFCQSAPDRKSTDGLLDCSS